jgi:hypothetical protein
MVTVKTFVRVTLIATLILSIVFPVASIQRLHPHPVTLPGRWRTLLTSNSSSITDTNNTVGLLDDNPAQRQALWELYYRAGGPKWTLARTLPSVWSNQTSYCRYN